MSNSVRSLLDVGSTGVLVDIECHISNGLPAIIIVGLGNKAIDEAKERIRSAFAACKMDFPRKRITINLAPADVPKDSTAFDLAIALAILRANGQAKNIAIDRAAIIGELGLEGKVRAVRGIIGKLLAGKFQGIRTFYIPADNMQQALLVPDITLFPVDSLKDLYQHFTGEGIPAHDTKGGVTPTILHPKAAASPFRDVAGQQVAKRALEVAAAGGHNIFLSGPPGTGKSMLAKALSDILPPMSQDEILEATHLHSLAGHAYEELVLNRPFRNPHHTASGVAIIGGGSNVQPGEVTLAHHGVLFLDEMPEFGHATLEALRQPLEDGFITIARAKNKVSFPANFMLVATANPCPCGYFGSSRACICSANTILRYRQRISGPILDRIDLYVSVETVEHERLLRQDKNIDEDQIRARIARARKIQAKRYANQMQTNARMSNGDIKNYAYLDSDAELTLNRAAKALELSARSYMRTIKVARTIADLAASKNIQLAHISEALQYRRHDPEIVG